MKKQTFSNSKCKYINMEAESDGDIDVGGAVQCSVFMPSAVDLSAVHYTSVCYGALHARKCSTVL